jgi:hypothetical protein
MLVAAVSQATQQFEQLAAALQALTGQRLEIQITLGASDQTEADAVKRGQRPELLAALRKAL